MENLIKSLFLLILFLLNSCSSSKKSEDLQVLINPSPEREKKINQNKDSLKKTAKRTSQKLKISKPAKPKKKKQKTIQLKSKEIRQKEVFITLLKTDYVKKSYKLFVKVNAENEIQAIKVFNTLKKKSKIYSKQVLREKITLVKALGISLVTLFCRDFSPKEGCELEIEYPW